MRISEIFNLHKSQAELDFVDIDISKDTPLFLDPFFLSKREDPWSLDALATLRNFFQQIINLIIQSRNNEAKELFDYLHEPNITCLGMSIGHPQGRGIGRNDANKLFERLIKSQAIKTGVIQDIEDNVLFIENFGKDKLSDMTTNIILWHLIQYTQKQCLLHNIPMCCVPSGFYWNRYKMEWETQYTNMLVYNTQKIILVPKGIVSYSKAYTPEKYYNHFVLNFMQQEHIRFNSALVCKRKDGTPYVTKKSIKETTSYSKEFLIAFTKAHPDILTLFKNRTFVSSLDNEDIVDINIERIALDLANRLVAIPKGNEAASDYHNIMIGILELLFYPHLISPFKEKEIHDGRKRIDIVFENAAERNTIFDRIINKHHIPCPYVLMECKNYSREVANPELDQLAGRFSPRRGKLGFLLCREIDNMQLFIQRCKDTFNDDRGLIIPIEDADIINLLNNIKPYTENIYLENFIQERIRNIIL